MKRSANISSRFVLAICVMAAGVFIAQSATTAPAAVRRALLIGISDYQIDKAKLPPGKKMIDRATDLQGARRDAEEMEKFLKTRGFDAEGSTKLVPDQQAERRRILSEIDNYLLAPPLRDSLLVFYYAGHGSYVPGADQQSPSRQAETIVPADANLGISDIIDKELAARFNRALKAGAKVVAIFDSCHSGSILRGVSTKSATRFVAPQTVPVEISTETNGESPIDHPNGLLLAAASATEQAEEKSLYGDSHGVFTYALLHALRAAPRDEAVGALEVRVRALTQNYGDVQTPSFSGQPSRRSQPLFDRAATSNRTQIAAIEAIEEDNRIIVSAGLAIGISEGALLAHHGERDGARIKVLQTLGLSRSVAQIVKRGTKKLEIGDRFDVVNYGQPLSGLTAAFHIEAAAMKRVQLEQLRPELDALRRHPCIRWIEDPTDRTARLVLSLTAAGWQLDDTQGNVSVQLGRPTAAGQLTTLLNAQLGRLGFEGKGCNLQRQVALFLRVPIFEELRKQILDGEEWRQSLMSVAADEASADYVLVGRLRDGAIDYVWMRPNISLTPRPAVPAVQPASWLNPVATGRARELTTPLRGLWMSIADSDVAGMLRRSAVGLNRVKAWHTISGPARVEPFAYEVRLKNHKTGDWVQSGVELPKTYDQEQFQIHIVHRKNAPSHPRHLYVFNLDQFGRIRFLYPLDNMDRRIFHDTDGDGHWVNGTVINCASEFGIETMVALSSHSPISNAEAIFSVPENEERAPPRKNMSALETFLFSVGDKPRSAPSATPIDWTIERSSRRCMARP